MNKRSFAMLEKAFVAEIEAAVGDGIGLIQSKSRVAELLVEDGYLQEASKTFGGRFAVTVKGYRLTELGRFAYCTGQL